MIVRNLVSRLLSSGVLVLVLLLFSSHAPSASALNLFPRRQFWTSLQASANEPETRATQEVNSDSSTQFERVVRKVTGNKEYKFGEITRAAAKATSSVVEGTVRTVTNNDDYQFGDMTKTVIGSTTHGIEGRNSVRLQI